MIDSRTRLLLCAPVVLLLAACGAKDGDVGDVPEVGASESPLVGPTSMPTSDLVGPQPPIGPEVPTVAETAADYPELKIVVKQPGEGERVVEKGDTCKFHYMGVLLDGTQFDGNFGKDPIEFAIGTGAVIKGWDLGLVGMKKGEKRKLTIPADLAYGPQARAKIPANSTLVFDVELVDFVDPK